MKSYKTVNAYVASYPKPIQSRLNKLRAAIRKAAPEAVESISYGMIGYKYLGRPLVYLGGFDRHIGFFGMPSARIAFKKELSKYAGTKSSTHLMHDAPLPLGLIGRMTKFRVKENLARAKKKR